MLTMRAAGFDATRLRDRLVGFAKFTGHVYGWYTLPWVLVGLALFYMLKEHGIDYDANVWLPAKAVLHGQSPYPKPELAALVGHTTFLYPPILLAVDVPLAVLPYAVGRAVFVVLTIAAVLGALRIADVQDRRVYLCAGLSFPVWY